MKIIFTKQNGNNTANQNKSASDTIQNLILKEFNAFDWQITNHEKPNKCAIPKNRNKQVTLNNGMECHYHHSDLQAFCDIETTDLCLLSKTYFDKKSSKYIIKIETHTKFLGLMGYRFVVGEDYSAKHTEWVSLLTITETRILLKV